MVMVKVVLIVASVFLLQGCITKIVTVPVKVAYKTTKGVVKGTAAVVEAIIPDGEEDSSEEQDKKTKD
jgi:hypothetical protein